MSNITVSVSWNLSSSKAPNVTTAAVGVTAIEFWVTLIFFMGFANGTIGTIGNSAIAIGVLRSKKFRTRFFIMICYLAVSRAITGVQSMVNVIYRTLRTLNYVSVNMTRAACYLMQFQTYYSLTLEMLLLLTLVIDRTLAVVAYKYYRRLTYRQAEKSCAVITMATIALKLVPSLLGVNFGEIISCINSNSPLLTAYSFYTMYLDVVLAAVTLVIYIYLIVYVRFRFTTIVGKSTSQEGEQARKAFNQHTKLMPVLTRLVWLHVGLTFSTKIFTSTQHFFPPEIGIRIATYSSALVAIDVVANTAVLLIGNNDLRRACFPCWNKVSRSVAPGPSSTQQVTQRSSRTVAAGRQG